MIDQQQPLTSEERAAWPGVRGEVPSDFADSVAATWLAEVKSKSYDNDSQKNGLSRSHKVGWSLALGLAAALILVFVLVSSGTGGRPRFAEVKGEAQLATRQTIDLSERAVVVGEAGAHLRWHLSANGKGRIEQSQGRAFYRVEPGPAFDVLTPNGTIRVVGTCFSVEVIPMKTNSMKSKSAAIGALLATAVTVTVYEGSVVLADNENADVSTLALGPGDRGVVEAHGSPRLLAGKVIPGGSAEELASRIRLQAKELDHLRAAERSKAVEVSRLRERLEELGEPPSRVEGSVEGSAENLDHSKVQVDAKKCATEGRSDECSFVEPEQATLLEMARCGTIRSDYPSFLSDDRPIRLSPEAIVELGLSDNEHDALIQAAQEHRVTSSKALQQIFVDVGGGAPQEAAEMPVGALDAVIKNLIDRDETQAAQRRLAHERAGVAEPPSSKSPLTVAERWVRHIAERGNAFEAVVSSVIGAERARVWRLKDNGWSGNTSVWSSDCEDLP